MSTIHETISLLEQFNKWRRGDDTITMPDSFELGVAIGDAVRLLREHVTLQSEFEKVTLLAAQTADRNVELRFRAENAEAQLHALTLICGTSDANKFQSWVDKERERAEKAETELARLRALFPKICDALGNGSCCTSDVGLDFLEAIPGEVKSVVDRLRAEHPEWSRLKAWGGTPEIVHAFIKGQQNRIHYCQNLEDDLSAALARAEKAEAECLEQARLLGMSGEREADLLGKISRLHSIIERASVQFFHEGTDGETAVKMLTILTKAKHELNAGVNKQDL